MKFLTKYLGLPAFVLWTIGVWGYILLIHEPDPADFDPIFLGHPTEILSFYWILSLLFYSPILLTHVVLKIIIKLKKWLSSD